IAKVKQTTTNGIDKRGQVDLTSFIGKTLRVRFVAEDRIRPGWETACTWTKSRSPTAPNQYTCPSLITDRAS
ncbi:MAG: hypothetical protein M5U34_21415, partial [Chloroflexi bacterium]|nr:hypothetical protein [Chloroflexota bacterium]